MSSGSFANGLFNLMSWVGNVIMPTLAVLFVSMGVYNHSKARGGTEKYITAALAALSVSALNQLAIVFMSQSADGDQYYNGILTLVNWVGNVVLPLYAGVEVVQALLAYMSTSALRAKEQWIRHLTTAIGCLCVSALSRLLEYFIAQGANGLGS